MEQAVLNAAEAAPEHVERERREPPPPALIPGWRCLPRALIRANGEEGYVDLAALNAVRGVVLVALLEPDEEASPEEARTAFLAMLEQEGFERRFPGELPVVALAQRRAEADQLAAAVDRAFAALPPVSFAEEWVEWLAERLGPDAPPPAVEPAPALSAPRRDEAPPERATDALPLLAPTREEEAVESAPPIEVSAEMPPQSEPEQAASVLDWGASFGFAAGVVLALLVGLLALLSRAGRIF
ncbi:MAG TPA: hypothetical protein VN668_07610 [Stellaceae bacterium]|nr:hypothetical protein [Stellaceae bacterium]